MNVAMFDGESEWEKTLGAKYDLNVTEEDLMRFDHYTGNDKQFLVSFIMRWRNKALDKTRASLQNAFQAIVAKVKEVKYEEARMEKEEYQRKSLEVLVNVKSGERSKEDVEHVGLWLSKMKLGGDKLSHLEPEQIKNMSAMMDVRILPANSLVFLQGDQGEYYYWVIDGSVELYTAFTAAKELALREQHKDRPGGEYLSVDVSELGNHIASMEREAGFGELRFSTKTYNASIRSMHSEKMDTVRKIGIMKSFKLFSSWPTSALSHLSYKMEIKEYAYNDKMAVVGEAIRDIYLLAEGEISLTSRIKVEGTNVLDTVTYKEVQLATINTGSILGDIETTVDLVKSWKVAATVKSSTARVLVMTKEDFVHLVLNSPGDVGEKIRSGAEAVFRFRRERLLEAQRLKLKEKKVQVDKKNSESKTVEKLRQREKTTAEPSINPFNLPGLRDNSKPTSPRTLRKLQSRSMGQMPRHFGEGGRPTPTLDPKEGFAHYSGALQSSFGAVQYGGKGAGAGAGADANTKTRKSFKASSGVLGGK
ncbi:hypothetical protein TL16_g04577 [Triparma laevis f. inornata]|uniref:Cyclic nucleotide-binding domain-containing protein n=1 Tax=Triparma laevis f. inornata TaxID=1714386 RepID=A0A9W7A788_9STRA|nr:hypothetical protein TL16_g04577 [Triparma laevis f. inornata]